jgi:hypothetical protein
MEVAIHDRTHNLPAEIRAYIARRVMGLADNFDLLTAAGCGLFLRSRSNSTSLHVVKVTLRVLGHRMPAPA